MVFIKTQFNKLKESWKQKAEREQERRKIVSEVYRDTVDIFAKKLNDDDKKILLKKMESRTYFSCLPNAFIYSSPALIGNALVFGMANSAIGVAFGAALLAVNTHTFYSTLKRLENREGLFDNVFGSIYFKDIDRMSCLFYGYYGIKRETVFHEAVHFLEKEGIIKRKEGPGREGPMAMAAEMLYGGYSIERGTELMKAVSTGDRSRYRESGKYLKGCALGIEALKIRDAMGMTAAWDFLYDKSQQPIN